MRQNVSYYMQDKHQLAEGIPGRWTFGSGSTNSCFGGAHLDGTVSLHWMEGGQLLHRRIKCRSYRRAVRLLRWHLMGYKV